jgi:hypothetical protein
MMTEYNTSNRDEYLDHILTTIGRKLIELRLRKGYTSHVDFAEDHDLPRIQYWRMEKGRANITIKSLDRVAAIHGYTVQEFLSIVFKDVARGNGLN